MAILLSVALAQSPAATAPQDTVGLASQDPARALEVARYALDVLEDARARIAALLEEAEQAGDAEAITCVEGRQELLDPLIEVARRAHSEVVAMLAEGQADRADHELRKLLVAQHRGEQILAEAQACLGGGPLASQTVSEVEWAVDYVDPEETPPEEDLGSDPWPHSSYQ